MVVGRGELARGAVPHQVSAPSAADHSSAHSAQSSAQSSARARDAERLRLAELHDSMASLHASRGQWQVAYQHLRTALDLMVSAPEAPTAIPEQLRHEVDRLRKEHAEARELSLRDSLTATYNRRYLDENLAGVLAATDAPAAVAIVDLDFFKHVNDTHGHLLGDRVLQRVVDVLQHGLPDGAFCARYGGEEFVLVLPFVQQAEAVAICEAARAQVERYPWSQLAAGLHVTVSIGVEHRDNEDGGSSEPNMRRVEDMLVGADQLLYTAKQAGRNAVAYRHADGVALAGAASARRIGHLAGGPLRASRPAS